jgi:hypothetical protein
MKFILLIAAASFTFWFTMFSPMDDLPGHERRHLRVTLIMTALTTGLLFGAKSLIALL